MDLNTTNQPDQKGSDLKSVLLSLDYIYYIGKRTLVILLVVWLGFLALNQFIDFRYKAVFIQKPCQLCAELNPEVSTCLSKTTSLYPDGKGGWYDPANIMNTYNISLESIKP